MTTVTIYGKTSSNYEYLKIRVLEMVRLLGIDIKLKEVKDVEVFVNKNLTQIPSVEINDQLINNSADINSYIDEVSHFLLKEEGYNNMKKLIVATDFSETSDNAINYTYQLSKYLRSVIKLLHIYRPKVSTSFPDDISEYMLEDIAKDKLSDIKDKLVDRNISQPNNETVVETNINYGLAADQILDSSSEEDNSIIVMGSSGTNNTLKKIFGSVSLSVVAKASKPVLVIPPEADFKILNKIAYCTENPTVDATTIHELKDIVQAFDSEIHLIHIKEQDHVIDEGQVLKIWKKNFPYHTIILNIIEHEDKLVAVNDYCERNNINLLSMTRSSQGFFKNLFHKSFTKRMLINSQIPLLIMNKN